MWQRGWRRGVDIVRVMVLICGVFRVVWVTVVRVGVRVTVIESGDFVVGVVYGSTVFIVVLIGMWIAVFVLTTGWRVIVMEELTIVVM